MYRFRKIDPIDEYRNLYVISNCISSHSVEKLNLDPLISNHKFIKLRALVHVNHHSIKGFCDDHEFVYFVRHANSHSPTVFIYYDQAHLDRLINESFIMSIHKS